MDNYSKGLASFGIPLYGGGGPLGIGCGNVYYTATTKTSSNLYYAKLIENGVEDSKIFTTLATAYAATTGDQNDVIVATPGTYTETASIAWAKNNTHLIGTAGPLSRGGMGTGVCFNCATVAIESVVDVQGSNCQFYDIQLRNVAANAGNLCALKVSDGVNFYAQGCHFNGQGAATQVATAGACALWLYTDSGGKPWGATFKDCKIGDAGEIVRTAGPIIYFSGGAAGTAKYVSFIDCVIEGWSETAATPAVEFNENYCIDRYVLFKNSVFYNYYVNNAANLTQVFDNDCGTTFKVLLKNTSQTGWAAWNSDGLQYIYTDVAAAGATGGLMTATT